MGAADMTDEQLADQIHELSDALHHRIINLKRDNWLNRQLDGAALEVRSWPTWKQTVARQWRQS